MLSLPKVVVVYLLTLVVCRAVLEAKENYLALPLNVAARVYNYILLVAVISIAVISITMMPKVHAKQCPEAFQ